MFYYFKLSREFMVFFTIKNNQNKSNYINEVSRNILALIID